MNYRHAYHAGNFADVVKHAVLALAIERLKLKDTPFRVIDTHAGIGDYDLASDQALRTGEWREGIGRLYGPDAAPMPEALAALLRPYLDVVEAANADGRLSAYPGSPRIARALMRPQDRLIANELHPEDATALRHAFARDRQTKVLELDGFVALRALLPPKERRGVILLDPPFEATDEFGRLGQAMTEAMRRFATGVYIVWYPLKDCAAVAAFHDGLVANLRAPILRAELIVRRSEHETRLSGTGLIIVNPPYRLDEQVAALLDNLVPILGANMGAMASVAWLVDDTDNPI